MRELKIKTYHETYNRVYDKEDVFKLISKEFENDRSIDILYWHPLEPIGVPIDIPSQVVMDEYYVKILYEFETFLIDRDIKIYFLCGGSKLFDSWAYGDYVIKNVKILPWKTACLHYTLHYLEQSYNKPINEININPSFEKLFLCLNRHPRPNRTIIIDELCKNDLFNHGLISWNKLSTTWHNPYDFECWEEKVMTLDMNNKIEIIEEVNQDSDFNTDFLLNNKCLFNLVGETLYTNHEIFLSEKTFKNLLIGQPMLVTGPLHHNSELEKLGFKKYEGIFDYEFDNERDLGTKIKMFVQNLNQYKTSNLQELYQKIEDVVQHNKNKSVEIGQKDPFVPIELFNFFKENRQKFLDNKFITRACDLDRIFKNF
jgi:hypothetical protein